MTPSGQARFWVLIAVFALLVAGSADVSATLWRWSAGTKAGSEAATAAGGANVALPLISLGLMVTAGLLAIWLVRCVVGWRAARRGHRGYRASSGSGRVTAAIWALVVANLAATVVLTAVALAGDQPQSVTATAGVDVLTTGSNAWVLLYYRTARRWDGARALAG